MTRECDFALVLLKGAIEHDDGRRYFGSLMAYGHHLHGAVARGLVDEEGKPTDKGRQVYADERLGNLPKEGRGYMWKWGRDR